jgi:toxin CcdB
VQDNQLHHLSSRVVVPLLYIEAAPPPIARLTPVFVIGDRRYLMMTYQMAAMPAKELGVEVAQLDDYRVEIIKAIDFLLTGV